jgi:non-ribosomal peptide synthetase component F
MHIIPKKCFSFPKLLTKFLNEKKVTSIWWATSAVNLVANSGILEIDPPRYVRIVTFGGESILPKQLNAWRKAVPNATLVNVYGPTEVTVDCTYYVIDREFGDSDTIPIGRHCENKNVLVLKDDKREAAIGETGELCMRGSGLSLGYYNDSERTASAFVQNPLHNLYADRIYRTGDLVKYNERGELVFVSRKDFQIKHMGYRIELGEIEAAVNAIDGVASAACVYDREHECIVLFYTSVDNEDKDIINLVKNRLPKYMFPEKVIRLETMPFNANGKIDRIKLGELLVVSG